MGSQRVGCNWVTKQQQQVALVLKNPHAKARDVRDEGLIHGSGRCPRREWQPAPVFLPGESHVQRSLVGDCPQHRRVGYDWSNLACTVPNYTYTYRQSILNICGSYVLYNCCKHWPREYWAIASRVNIELGSWESLATFLLTNQYIILLCVFLFKDNI